MITKLKQDTVRVSACPEFIVPQVIHPRKKIENSNKPDAISFTPKEKN